MDYDLVRHLGLFDAFYYWGKRKGKHGAGLTGRRGRRNALSVHRARFGVCGFDA